MDPVGNPAQGAEWPPTRSMRRIRHRQIQRGHIPAFCRPPSKASALYSPFLLSSAATWRGVLPFLLLPFSRSPLLSSTHYLPYPPRAAACNAVPASAPAGTNFCARTLLTCCTARSSGSFSTCPHCPDVLTSKMRSRVCPSRLV